MEETIFLSRICELCTELDLNDMRHNVLLSIIFRVSVHSQNIDIKNRANCGFISDLDRECDLPLSSKFWETRELYDSITNQFRVVRIRGFAGREREMRLVSHLIRNATMLEKIEIECNDTCSREGGVTTLGLRWLPKSSIDALIILKPGRNFMEQFVADKEFVTNVGDIFEYWLSTLGWYHFEFNY